MIRIVTDATASLPYNLAAQMGVIVVPISYSIAGRLYHESYPDKSFDLENLITQNPGKCLTSHPPVSEFADVFRNLTQNGDDVLCLVISSRLSGTYSSANIATREAEPGKVIVVDSLTTAGGLALLIQYASTLISQGLTLAEVVSAVKKKRDSVGIVFSVNDMTSLRKSGRLGDVRQSVSNVLNVRPILTCTDGWVKAQGISRGDTQTLKALLERVSPEATDIVIHHQGEKYNPVTLMHTLQERLPDAHIEIRPMGAALRIHLGAGFIVIAWIVK
ncbi:MAG: DegV family protein [Clostridiales bacterium]|nr:DegV family protein [Clostridiales bacterium]